MKFKYSPLLIFLFFACFYKGQTNQLRVNPNIILPKDSSEAIALVSAINSFLMLAQKPNEENRFVLETQKLETFILLDEINGIEKSSKFKDAFFYKPYLLNLTALKDSNYSVQISFIGISEGVALLRANFEIIAYKVKGAFVFSSPLKRNTRYWKIKKVGNNIFHYQSTINKSKVKEFNKLATAFDKKLKSINKVTDYYCCDNIIEMQRLIGVDYKSDNNGRSESVLSSVSANRKLIALGNNSGSFDNFDPHDLFHSRLSLVVPRSKVNKPVDEGCAYIYGGSWGLTWKEIFKEFNDQIASDKNVNWLEIKETPIFFKTRGFSNSADYIVNALLVKKVEKEKGFQGVWELLTIGPFEKGNEKYYKTLEKLTGITKENYNEKIDALIHSEK